MKAISWEQVVLVLASTLAAVGQLLFKTGASGRTSWREFLNVSLLGGLVCYGLGTMGWVFALSRLPLKVVYPYTVLTFVLVYLGAVVLLGEKLHLRAVLGVMLVLAGLYLLTGERTAT